MALKLFEFLEQLMIRTFLIKLTQFKQGHPVTVQVVQAVLTTFSEKNVIHFLQANDTAIRTHSNLVN